MFNNNTSLNALQLDYLFYMQTKWNCSKLTRKNCVILFTD